MDIVSGDVENIIIKPDLMDCDSEEDDVIQTPFYLESYFGGGSRSPSPLEENEPEIVEVDRVTCYDCDIVFCSEHKLLEHMMTHIDIYTLGCEICNKDLKMEEKFQLHMMTVTWQCIYYCDFCRKSCAGVVRSKSHPPPPGKTYMCHDCEIESKTPQHKPSTTAAHDECKYFSSEQVHDCCDLQTLPKIGDSSVKSQKSKIKAVRQFKCKYCPSGFSEHFQLMKHLNDKHQFHKLKYLCKFCGKEFVQQRCYINHVNFHQISNQNMCYMCNVAFFTKCELDEHLKLHDKIANNCVAPMDLSSASS